MTLPLWFNIIFLNIAIFFSSFYGLKAFEIFQVNTVDKPRSWKIHQIWFNFSGSIAGWIALWLLIRKILHCIMSSSFNTVDISDSMLFLLAFIGITGHLPYTIAGIIESLKELATKITGILK